VEGVGLKLSVVVASHDRPLRLRWLLNALEEQTLDRAGWEVVVAHDASGPETEALLRSHPLATAGVLRHLSFAPGPGPAAKRNAAWRLARADTILFTDDDCRPPADWLASALAAVERHPGSDRPGHDARRPRRAGRQAPRAARAQPGGHAADAVRPDLQHRRIRARCWRPSAASTRRCRSPRARTPTWRSGPRPRGAQLVAAPEVLTYHAVEAVTLPARLRETWRWQHLAYIVGRHPQLRDHMPLRLFWKPSHALLLPALAGLWLARRHPFIAALLIAPWALVARPAYGSSPRGLARAASELPARMAVDITETAAMARGSLRHRTPML
jgi:glycosyltransferase involved in cell wall biosynthesis